MMNEFPEFLFIDDSTITLTAIDNIIRSDMDNGMAKTKPNQSSPIYSISFSVFTHKENILEFNSWFRNIRHGALWFLMRSPVNGKMKKYRFRETQISWKKEGSLWGSNFELEYYGE